MRRLSTHDAAARRQRRHAAEEAALAAQGATFRPSILPASAAIAERARAGEGTGSGARRRRLRAQQLREERRAAEERELTFRPDTAASRRSLRVSTPAARPSQTGGGGERGGDGDGGDVNVNGNDDHKGDGDGGSSALSTRAREALAGTLAQREQAAAAARAKRYACTGGIRAHRRGGSSLTDARDRLEQARAAAEAQAEAECPFTPSINAPGAARRAARGAADVAGLERYLELRALARQREAEAARAERCVQHAAARPCVTPALTLVAVTPQAGDPRAEARAARAGPVPLRGAACVDDVAARVRRRRCGYGPRWR